MLAGLWFLVEYQSLCVRLKWKQHLFQNEIENAFWDVQVREKFFSRYIQDVAEINAQVRVRDAEKLLKVYLG